MKNKFLVLAVLAALSSAPAFASVHEGWVYNGLTGIGYGNADLGGGDDLDGDSFSSNFNIGYRWGVVGLEVGYASFGEFDGDTVVGTTPINLDLSLDGFTFGVNVNGDINDKWAVQGRVGAFAWNADGHAASGATRVSFEDDGTDFYAGVSISYNWSERSSIGLGYTYFSASDADVGLLGMHSEFRF